MPLKIKITAGNIADCTEAEYLISDIKAKAILADKGYDTNQIVEMAQNAGMEVVIPPKSNRREQRKFNKEFYKRRHLVENAFLWLKRWRGIATRYAKNTLSFLSAVQIRFISIWLKYLSGKTCVDTI